MEIEFIIDNLLDHKRTKLNDLDRELFKLALKKQKVVVFLDSFDEIELIYEVAAVKMIKVLLKYSKKMFITTRPNKTDFLLDKLNPTPVFSVQMEPLNEDLQESYLHTFIMDKWKITNDSQIKSYMKRIFNLLPNSGNPANNNNLLSIPLHIDMLTEIFETKEAADKFLKDSGESINTWTLYEKFIERKFTISLEKTEGLKQNSSVMADRTGKELPGILNNLKLAALKQIFNSDQLESFLSEQQMEDVYIGIKDFLKKFETHSYSLIIDIIQRRPVFVHRTLAEYLVADFIIDLLIDPNTDESSLMFIFGIIFQDHTGGCKEIVMFLNQKLTEDFCNKRIQE